MMKDSSRVVPEDVPRPFRSAASFRFQGFPGSQTRLEAAVPLWEGAGLCPSQRERSGTGQYCGQAWIFPSSLTVPTGTP